jgi:hypothetical protein
MNADPIDPSMPTDPSALPGQPVVGSSVTTDAPTSQSDVPGGSNPLDALEQILKEAKAKAESSGEKPAAMGAQKAEPAEADEAAKKAAILAQQQEQQVEDEAAITEQLANLQGVVDTPAYQARVAQDEARKQAEQAKQEQSNQFAIHQLGHTKI